MDMGDILRALKKISGAIDDNKTKFEPIGQLSAEKQAEWEWFLHEIERIQREFKFLEAKRDLWWAELRMSLPQKDAERNVLRIQGSTVLGSIDEEDA